MITNGELIQINVHVDISKEQWERLKCRATARDVPPMKLAADLMDAVLRDDLIDAIMDDEE